MLRSERKDYKSGYTSLHSADSLELPKATSLTPRITVVSVPAESPQWPAVAVLTLTAAVLNLSRNLCGTRHPSATSLWRTHCCDFMGAKKPRFPAEVPQPWEAENSLRQLGRLWQALGRRLTAGLHTSSSPPLWRPWHRPFSGR